MLNQHTRYQKGLNTLHLFPSRSDGTCACGCGETLQNSKKRWFSDNCRYFAVTTTLIVKGDTRVIRQQLQLRDNGKCANCGCTTFEWEADHIKPVELGGGGCDLDNFQTLCTECHKEKTLYQRLGHLSTISLAEASICCHLRI
jgi:5-methylcytosine-specific restriction endonuclease McrA